MQYWRLVRTGLIWSVVYIISCYLSSEFLSQAGKKKYDEGITKYEREGP